MKNTKYNTNLLNVVLHLILVTISSSYYFSLKLISILKKDIFNFTFKDVHYSADLYFPQGKIVFFFYLLLHLLRLIT